MPLHPGAYRRSAHPSIGVDQVSRPGRRRAAGTRGAVQMPRAKKHVTAADELTAEDRRKFADVLSESHEELCLWRKCERQPCRRTRCCRGEVDECGARYAPKEWARVRRGSRVVSFPATGERALRARFVLRASAGRA